MAMNKNCFGGSAEWVATGNMCHPLIPAVVEVLYISSLLSRCLICPPAYGEVGTETTVVVVTI
jgi:hypothetical protein